MCAGGMWSQYSACRAHHHCLSLALKKGRLVARGCWHLPCSAHKDCARTDALNRRACDDIQNHKHPSMAAANGCRIDQTADTASFGHKGTSFCWFYPTSISSIALWVPSPRLFRGFARSRYSINVAKKHAAIADGGRGAGCTPIQAGTCIGGSNGGITPLVSP